MAKWEFSGLDKYVEQLHQLEANTDEIIGRAIYEGAGIVADAARASIEGLTVDDEYHRPGEQRNGPRTEEKEGLLEGFGISKMTTQKSYTYVKIGFHGRNPNGLMNSGAARQIESGTSWMKKQPFMTKAVNANKKKCEETMQKVFDEEIEKLVK